MYISPGVTIIPVLLDSQFSIPKSYIPFTIGPFISGEEKYFEKLAEPSSSQFEISDKFDIPGFSNVDLNMIVNYIINNNPTIFWTMIWYGVPYPLARLILAQAAKASLQYLSKNKKGKEEY